METNMQEMLKTIGSWLFLIGIVISVIIGIVFAAELWADTNGYVSILLAVLGFIVGILSFFAVGNITRDRVPTFLIAALLLVGIGATSTWFGQLNVIGPYLEYIAGMLAVFVAPAAGLLAIRAIWDAGKTEQIEKVIPKMPGK
jgi:hypothetical protein